jgi:TetR/AcrR family transcriptional regulator, regulator of biofilm formation and stress response
MAVIAAEQGTEDRRARIVAGALGVLARVGPDGLTHRLVAAEAGVPLAATTYWFASKEAIIEAAMVQVVAEGEAAVQRRREEQRSWTRASAPMELARSIERECTTERERTVVGYALWVEAQRRPALRPHAERWTRAYADLHAELLRALGATGDVTHAAMLLGAAIDGLVAQQLVAAEPLPADELAAVLEPLLPAAR